LSPYSSLTEKNFWPIVIKRVETLKGNILAGIFCLTAANLSLEIIATRYFSITQSHHLAFFVVSTAFLGFGVSGGLLFLRVKPGQPPSPTTLCVLAFLFSLTILACVPLMNAFPFETTELLWAKGRLSHLLLISLFLALPFFFSGWSLASLTSIYASAIHRLYAADLTGVAFGAFLPSLLFLPRGDRGVFILISLLALTATLLLSLSLAKKILFPAAGVFLALLVGLVHPPQFLEFRLSPYKPVSQALQSKGAELLFTRWNAISRIDIVSSPSLRFAPGLSLAYSGTLPEQFGLFTDGGQPSALTSFLPEDSQRLSFLNYLPSSLPFFLLARPSVLIIEPRGGLEILTSLYYGAKRIKVIESNPLIPSLLKKELADKTGSILSDPRVEVVCSLPRSAIKQDKDRYDLIIFSFPDILTASGTGFASLQEDHLHTRETLIQLWPRLSSQGMLTATFMLLPPAREELRMLATIIESMEAAGLDPKQSLLVLLSWGTVTFVAKKSPFTPAEINDLQTWAQERLFALGYFPGFLPSMEPEKDSVQAFPISLIPNLLEPSKREKLYQNYLFALRPATDDRPFFHHTIKLNRIRQSYAAFGHKWLPLLEGGGLYLLLLIQTTLVALVFLGFPLLLTRKRRLSLKSKAPRFTLIYFILIGAGFMSVEILLIQKGILFLGHPTQAVAVSLFALLLSSGAGSLLSSDWSHRSLPFPGWFLAASSLLILLDFFLWPPLLEASFSQPYGLRVVILLSLIFPTGFFLGFAFPASISRLRSVSPEYIPLAWSANALSSVVTSVLSIMLTLYGGYKILFFLASIYYGLALLFFRLSGHRNKAHP